MPRKWGERAEIMRETRRDLEHEVFAAFREPAKSQRDKQQYNGHVDRIGRCVAFGQFSDAVAPEEQERAQHGLYGTAAAFCVFSQSEWAASLAARPDWPNGDKWRLRYFETLNFLDFALSPDGVAGIGTGPQVKMTLRISLVMRAVAAGAGPLNVIGQNPFQLVPSQREQQVAEDLLTNGRTNLAQLPVRHSESILRFVKECVATPADGTGWFKAGGSNGEATLLYSVNDESAPRVVDEWVFTWSQVLAGISRLANAGLITSSDAEDVCSAASFRAFVGTVLWPKESLDLDPRFRLMGLWALSHFDDVTNGGPNSVSPGRASPLADSHLNVEGAKQRRLAKTIRAVARDLCSQEIALMDSWWPYSLKSSGEEWRDDSMVVPTVPILLHLVARYHPRALAETSLLNLARQASLHRDWRDVGRARPHQLGNRNGIVNLAYYHEALSELHIAYSNARASFSTRLKTTLHGMWWGYGRCGAVALIGGVTGAAYLFGVARPDQTWLTLVFGIGASFLAAISAPPVIRFFWGDRF